MSISVSVCCVILICSFYFTCIFIFMYFMYVYVASCVFNKINNKLGLPQRPERSIHSISNLIVYPACAAIIIDWRISWIRKNRVQLHITNANKKIFGRIRPYNAFSSCHYSHSLYSLQTFIDVSSLDRSLNSKNKTIAEILDSSNCYRPMLN